jgi:hypothetical protein
VQLEAQARWRHAFDSSGLVPRISQWQRGGEPSEGGIGRQEGREVFLALYSVRCESDPHSPIYERLGVHHTREAGKEARALGRGQIHERVKSDRGVPPVVPPTIGYFGECGKDSPERYASAFCQAGGRCGFGDAPAVATVRRLRPHRHREEIVRGVEDVLAMDSEAVDLAEGEDYVVVGLSHREHSTACLVQRVVQGEGTSSWTGARCSRNQVFELLNRRTIQGRSAATVVG